MNLQELLRFDSHQAMQFFYEELRDTRTGKRLSQLEAVHVSSALSHYAHVPIGAPAPLEPPPVFIPALVKRIEVLEKFRDCELADLVAMRTAGAQCLFVLAFCTGLIQSKKTRLWLTDEGKACYRHAHDFAISDNDRATYKNMSLNFELWILACNEMVAELKKNPFLLN